MNTNSQKMLNQVLKEINLKQTTKEEQILGITQYLKMIPQEMKEQKNIYYEGWFAGHFHHHYGAYESLYESIQMRRLQTYG